MRHSNRAQFVLAVLIVAGYSAVQGFILSHNIPPDMREIIMRTLGTLDMALGAAIGYFFGSSASSNAKYGLSSKAVEK